MSKNDWNKLNNVDFVEIFTGIKKELNLYDEESFIGFGWTHNFKKSGGWTEGNEANVIFKFRKYETTDYKLNFNGCTRTLKDT